MEWTSNLISEIYKYLNHRDDTGIDRLNRLYTVALLSAFVTLISSQQYIVGGRIVCWIPKEFTDAHKAYAYDICWLGHRNYYISENTTRLDNPSSPRSHPFLIYPWLPIILIGMTVSFTLPYLLIWHGLSTRSGIDIKRLIELNDHDASSRSIHFILFKKYSMKSNGGIYTIREYLTISIEKILKILSVKYDMWSSEYLPIETMCDFMIRTLGQNNNWYTIQCILPFNLFTKRIFALIIIWFTILLILNIIDFVYIWLWRRLWLSSHRYDYIFNLYDLYETYLQKNRNNHMIQLKIHNSILRQEFAYNYLKIDGYLLLKLLHANSSDINISYLVANLFNQFLRAKTEQSRIIKRHDNNTFV
ncbi:unnamed protein product [Rotaria sp. Silwood1]|nr:unnamed protein product [Rotaria sp. Silwood1]CAF4964164.1 unnamed protein product [Rotaria sp. Silwood1]